MTKDKTICENRLGDKDMLAREGCGKRQPSFKRDAFKLYCIHRENVDDEHEETNTRVELTPRLVNQLFKCIKDEDIINMGICPKFARPEWMIITALLVPPPQVRPPIAYDASSRAEDDLTFQLSTILRTNRELKKSLIEGAPSHIFAENELLMQFNVAAIIDNNISGMPKVTQKSGRPLKTISTRLKGKEGRIRSNLMGKRVDFSARTVITGDPNISIDEVGIPMSIAKTMTYPEMVTPYNIDKLQRLIKNGPTVHPGAKYIIQSNGERIDLRYKSNSSDTPLHYGYCVERHLNNGDIVIFNRQPSLHKMSMMGHKVRIMPYSTFRLNLSVTSPYNADFDGDEMNLHVPQSEESRVEIAEICMVPKQVVSPQSNKPVMGIVQDALLGIMKFTYRDMFLTRAELMNILVWIPDWDGNVPIPCITYPVPLWTGKQVITLIIPDGITCMAFRPNHDEKDTVSDSKVQIENGELLTGILCRKTVHTASGGLIHIIFNDKGPEVVKMFFNTCQMIINNWLTGNGFTIGIGDTIPDKRTSASVVNTINTAKVHVNDIINSASRGTLEIQPGMTMKETFENKINMELNRARDVAGTSSQKSLTDANNAKQMAMAGSKGTFINISQMSACVGQQNVEGKRIPYGFKQRTLPHFLKNDHGPESRGFVENSYLRGLTPQEFFFHAMGGREGLIDTAVKTAETGYIQRRLVKALEDIMVSYDGTVRNSLGQIVQFCYGEDGVDGTMVEPQKFILTKMSDEEFKNKFKPILYDKSKELDFEKPRLDYLNSKIYEEYKVLNKDRKFLQELALIHGDGGWNLPVNISRLIRNVRNNAQGKRAASDLNALQVIEKVEELIKKLNVVRGDDKISVEANELAIKLFTISLRMNLFSKRVISEYRMNYNTLTSIIGEIENKFHLSQCPPGEMVGVLAAQSIGEPATQMTLNTFHYAGVSSKNVTLGVPRLKEIINAAVNIKTPSLTVYLDPICSKNIEKAKEVQAQLEFCTLKHITSAIEIYYDPNPANTVIVEDQDFISAYFEMPDETIPVEHLSPWLLRIVLNRKLVIDKNLSMGDIKSAINASFEKDLLCICNDDNATNLIIHCRIVNDNKEMRSAEDTFLKKVEHDMLCSIVLKGVPNINKVYIIEKKISVIDELGKLDNRNEWILETDGINLKQVIALLNVDQTRTYSNSCTEIMEVLGIEAVRNALMKEIRSVIEFDGSYVNYRHLALLCDVMTARGSIMAITRFGINRSELGALARCSFEETVDVLMEAASTGESNKCDSISENIMLGQIAPLGSGCMELFLNEEELSKIDPNRPRIFMDKFGNLVDQSSTEFMVETLNMDPSGVPYSPMYTPMVHNKTPYGHNYGGEDAVFSPFSVGSDDSFSPGAYTSIKTGRFSEIPSYSPGFQNSPIYSPTSPNYSITSPLLHGNDTFYSPTSPNYKSSSPTFASVMKGFGGGVTDRYSPTSPSYSPTSPSYSPTSPSYSPTSPNISPTSPNYSPTSPSYSPTSPSYSPTSPSYSPTSPSYSPTSPSYSPTSPSYSPTNPSYSPSRAGKNMESMSPVYTQHNLDVRLGSGGISNAPSPHYSPSSPRFVASPAYSPTSPHYSPLNVSSSPQSPKLTNKDEK